MTRVKTKAQSFRWGVIKSITMLDSITTLFKAQCACRVWLHSHDEVSYGSSFSIQMTFMLKVQDTKAPVSYLTTRWCFFLFFFMLCCPLNHFMVLHACIFLHVSSMFPAGSFWILKVCNNVVGCFTEAFSTFIIMLKLTSRAGFTAKVHLRVIVSSFDLSPTRKQNVWQV